MLELLFRELEHEIRWEPPEVPLDRLHEHSSLDLVELRKVGIEHHLLAPDEMDDLLDALHREVRATLCHGALDT